MTQVLSYLGELAISELLLECYISERRENHINDLLKLPYYHTWAVGYVRVAMVK